MRGDHQSESSGRSGFTIGYDLGPVGTWVRILVGVIASTALITGDLLAAPPTLGRATQTAAWFAAILATYTIVYVALAPRVLARLSPWLTTALFYGPVLLLPHAALLPETLRLALTLYIVVSIAVVVAIRYGGNAVVAVPTLLTGRRHVVYCPWNAADLADKAIEDSPWSQHLRGPGVKVLVTAVVAAVLVAGFTALGPMNPLVWVLAAAVSIATPAAWSLVRGALARRGARFAAKTG